MAVKPVQLFLATGMIATLAACGGSAPVEEEAADETPVEEVAPEGGEEGGEGGEEGGEGGEEGGEGGEEGGEGGEEGGEG